jgi:LacI family transcriptional regulator
VAATILDVAAAAGVAASTVSRTFSRPELISPQTRDRVMTAARELGYVPRSVRTTPVGRTGNLGLVVPDIANPFFPPFIKATQNHALRSDFAVFLADTDEDPQAERRVVSHVVKQADGILLCSSRLSADIIREIARETKLVLVNRVVEGVPSVLLDTGDGMRQAIDHLAALGHRYAVYLSGPRPSWSNEQRHQGLQAQARKHHMKLRVLGPHISNFAAGIQTADSVLAMEATAVVAYDDVMALGVLARLSDRGVRVPEDISLIGCDDVAAAAMSRPALTTITVRYDIAGRAAVDLLVSLIGETISEPETVTLPTQLIIRQTTGPASGASAHPNAQPRRLPER